jgi:hypothetical protein
MPKALADTPAETDLSWMTVDEMLRRHTRNLRTTRQRFVGAAAAFVRVPSQFPTCATSDSNANPWDTLAISRRVSPMQFQRLAAGALHSQPVSMKDVL